MERPVEALRRDDEKINLAASTGFFLVHAACLLAFWTGVSWTAVVACIVLYYVRMFGITGGYHRYFAHRTYKTSRWFQLVLALIAGSAAQKGPLWWASHHRHHHKHSDDPEDVHSPRMRGLLWAHVGWILCDKYNDYNPKLIHDFEKYPELRFLTKYHLLPPIALGVAVFFFGVYLESAFPSLGTNGMQMLVWGFFVSTTLLYHGTFTINSLTHTFGKRRFQTTDDSRNSFILALVTMGEGWHNNHHRFPSAEPQGMYWWEVDFSHYILRMLSWVGIVQDIKLYPTSIYEEAERGIQPTA